MSTVKLICNWSNADLMTNQLFPFCLSTFLGCSRKGLKKSEALEPPETLLPAVNFRFPSLLLLTTFSANKIT